MSAAQDAFRAVQVAVMDVARRRATARIAGAMLLSLALLGAIDRAPAAQASDDATAAYKRIVLLDVRFPEGRGTCTGFVVGPHTVATAAHCLYSPASGGWARFVSVTPGVDGIDAPFERQTATVFEVPPAYIASADPAFDYGAITLPSDLIGIAVGRFDVNETSDSRLRAGAFETAGYASLSTWGTQWRMSERRRLAGFDQTALTYSWATTPGMSGAPIFEPAGDGYRALGIVTGKVFANGGNVEVGLRANAAMIEFYRVAAARHTPASPDAPAGTAFVTPRGRAVTVQSTSSAALDAPIVLQASSDRVRWTTIASGRTDAAGASTFTIEPTVTLYYRFVALGVGPGAVSQGVVDGPPPGAPELYEPAAESQFVAAAAPVSAS